MDIAKAIIPKLSALSVAASAGAGMPEDNDDQDQIDRHQHRVLHAENEEARPRRQLVDRVKQVFRSGHDDAIKRGKRNSLTPYEDYSLKAIDVGESPTMPHFGQRARLHGMRRLSASRWNVICETPFPSSLRVVRRLVDCNG